MPAGGWGARSAAPCSHARPGTGRGGRPGHAGSTVADLWHGGAGPGLDRGRRTDALTAADAGVDGRRLHPPGGLGPRSPSAPVPGSTPSSVPPGSRADLDDLAALFVPGPAQDANCIVAANFAIGAVLMMRFAELAAPWFEGAEIVELHHEPSSTHRRVRPWHGRGMAAARASAGWRVPGDRTTTRGGWRRGGRGPAGVRIHSVRLPGLVAHQEVILGAPGQGLTIRHDAYDRTSFMDGVVLAVRSVADRPGVTVGIEPLLGL